MGYKSYLIEQFDTTHENIFFKDFSEALSNKFQNESSNVILIGNLSINGNQLDALFIRKGQITVIDFKNYGGKLSFSENNHWSIENNRNIILVSGGAYNRNPFQQVNQYRRTVIDFLNSNENEILQGVRNDINWGHISAIVLFHQPIEFDINEIPKRLVYFHISDFSNSIELIQKINSNKLRLSNTEIEHILKKLNINDNNLFDQAGIVEDANDYEDKIKFDLLKRLVHNAPRNASEIHRILTYYRIILDVESYREENKLERSFTLDTNLSSDNITIDYTQDNRIYKELSNNQNERFPNNIFIGLKFSIGNTTEKKILLYQIILASEINYKANKNIVKASNFELYPVSFHELNLAENFIDELNNKIANQTNLIEKINVLKKELETLKIREEDKLTLAFSNKNLTNSQLSSELNRLSKNNLSELNTGIINNYLLNKLINNKNDEFPDLINITQLNSSQKEAVKASLENDLTVITGPPGTGKTQLVLNIIANSIINDKRILFASKNNKAVDNVIERFISDYLLRIGSNAIIESKLKPKLEAFINNKYDIKDTKSIKKSLVVCKNRINEIEELFRKEKLYPNEIERHRSNVQILKEEFQNYIKSINANEKRLFFDKDYIVELNQNNTNFELQKLQKKNSNFITRLFFSFFLKSKQLEKIISLENTIKTEIVDYVNSNTPLFQEGKSNLQLIINHLLGLIKIYESYIKHKQFKEINLHNQQSEEQFINQQQAELDWIINNKEELKKEYTTRKDEFIENSINYLKLFINNKLSKTNASIIADFRTYLNNAPWKDEEYTDYEDACLQFLNNFTAVSVTNLSVKKALSLSKQMFDLLVIDEASQCDIASAIPLIFRAKKLVVIGDPYQLRHITSVKKQYEENYILNLTFGFHKTNVINYIT